MARILVGYPAQRKEPPGAPDAELLPAVDLGESAELHQMIVDGAQDPGGRIETGCMGGDPDVEIAAARELGEIGRTVSPNLLARTGCGGFGIGQAAGCRITLHYQSSTAKDGPGGDLRE